MIVATMVIASTDARRWKVYRPGIPGMLILWIVFYPRYFLKRSERGAPPRFVLSLAAMAPYFVCALAPFFLVSR